MNSGQSIPEPFELLLAIEQRARDVIASRHGVRDTAEDWVGIGFRVGAEQFVTSRGDVREVLPLPSQVTRVPGAKPWLRGVANVRGQLLTVVDLKAFLGGGTTLADRRGRLLLPNSRDVTTGLLVDEVVGFRRFATDEFHAQPPATILRCDQYLTGVYRRGTDSWPCFGLPRLLVDEPFLMASAGTNTERAA